MQGFQNLRLPCSSDLLSNHEIKPTNTFLLPIKHPKWQQFCGSKTVACDSFAKPIILTRFHTLVKFKNQLRTLWSYFAFIWIMLAKASSCLCSSDKNHWLIHFLRSDKLPIISLDTIIYNFNFYICTRHSLIYQLSAKLAHVSAQKSIGEKRGLFVDMKTDSGKHNKTRARLVAPFEAPLFRLNLWLQNQTEKHTLHNKERSMEEKGQSVTYSLVMKRLNNQCKPFGSCLATNNSFWFII